MDTEKTPLDGGSHLRSPHERSLRPVQTIEPQGRWPSLRLGDLFRHWELLYFLVWRDIKVRYKQSVLGVGWAILQPLLTMVVFSIFFGRLANMPSDGVPYPIFAYAALLPWTYFATSINQAANSLVANSSLVQKVYFPRIIAPVASCFSGLADLAAASSVFFVLMLYYRTRPTAAAFLLPLFLLLAVTAALGVGLWLAALHVKYRDVKFLLPFMVQGLLIATPIAYPSSLVPRAWQPLYAANPMAGVVDGFRWALLDAQPPGAELAVSVGVAVLLVLSGAFYFRRTEETFADLV